MPKIQEGIDVDVPFWAAYEQWTRPDHFPEFLGHVLAANRIDEDQVRFVTKTGAMRREFIVRMLEERPDRAISWSSTVGSTFCEVTLESLSHDRSHVEMSVYWDGTAQSQHSGSLFRQEAEGIRQDLASFKEHMELRLWDTRVDRGGHAAPSPA
ncbi:MULTISPECIES: SRPBCC family protein [Arthrobacter]|uniref:SRPBCC family protein n=2 Tax=Arthrobacter TaxID=1663 RepID=A0ABU9KJ88_9MICC|nr:SRPBCC family protein [Arthrobacter sp. YJM1]MDP5226791.1 SRPBCC family protein [Arthrobacter sp. YJM1]